MANEPSLWEGFFDTSVHYTSPLLTEAMVAAAEATLGYPLPESYLRLLRVKNGGVPRRQCHPASEAFPENHVRVNVLFGIGGQWGIDSVEFGTRHQVREGGFPEIGIIIGWTTTSAAGRKEAGNRPWAWRR